MIFISLLIAATAAIASSAAYFSVYGLAYTFSGVFWSVVIMGSSLEAGKLIAASFLYRYWNRINIWLKSYLLLGTAALMLLTSVGIFGYLSAGFQQDILPLKQKQEQVKLLEVEKVRILERKTQIDAQLAGGTQLNSVQNSAGKIDPNAARVLREANRGRSATASQYKAEQTAVNARISELDKELLTLKQDLIKVEAHTGPITYIAKVLGEDPDNATVWLIMIIIFAFDPMAVALTLAVNIALRLRKEDQQAILPDDEPPYQFNDADWQDIDPTPEPSVEPEAEIEPEPTTYEFSGLNDNFRSFAPVQEMVEETPEPVPTEEVVPELELLDKVPEEPAVVPEPVKIVETTAKPLSPVVPTPDPAVRRTRRYESLWDGSQDASSESKIAELFEHRRILLEEQAKGVTLSKDELWELQSIETILQRHGLGGYL